MKQRLQAAVAVKFKLECRDKAGALLKTIDVETKIPPAKLAALIQEAKK